MTFGERVARGKQENPELLVDVLRDQHGENFIIPRATTREHRKVYEVSKLTSADLKSLGMKIGQIKRIEGKLNEFLSGCQSSFSSASSLPSLSSTPAEPFEVPVNLSAFFCVSRQNLKLKEKVENLSAKDDLVGDHPSE